MHQELHEQVATLAPDRPHASRRLLTRDQAIGLALVSPSIILIAVFIYGFIGRTAYISLVRWNDLAARTTPSSA